MSVSCVQRLTSLRGMLAAANRSRPISVMEAHSGLSALIGEKAKSTDGKRGFDALWSSSLTSSTIKAKPDIEVVDTTQRLQIVEDILESSTLPLIYDGDTGGHDSEIFKFTVKKLNRLGVSAVIIEDKTGLKQNSLFGTDAKQVLWDPEEFAEKLLTGQKAKLHDEFMVVSRLESLIAGIGVADALERAKIYVEKGEVDAVMIHSKEKEPDEVLEFLTLFNQYLAQRKIDKPGSKHVYKVAVPTTYNTITEQQLFDQGGVDVVIHANHLLRAAYPWMWETAQSILDNGRSNEIETAGKVMSVKKIINML